MALVTVPIAAWLLCGIIKFAFNLIRNGSRAYRLIGHGGFPSNHTAILSSIMWGFLIEGQWRMTGFALAVLMIVVFDATGLRREIGLHAVAINKSTGSNHREILGHTSLDVVGGLLVGLAVAAGYRLLESAP